MRCRSIVLFTGESWGFYSLDFYTRDLVFQTAYEGCGFLIVCITTILKLFFFNLKDWFLKCAKGDAKITLHVSRGHNSAYN